MRIVHDNGTVVYTNEKGELHRLDGPAHITRWGEERWYINNILHRDREKGGPAVIYYPGACEWFENGIKYAFRWG